MLLELKNVKKYFPAKKNFFGATQEYVRAVDNIDFHLRSGENLSIVGESGCGKTTLARVIMKLYPLDSGTILLEGKDITKMSAAQMRPYRSRLQMVFQDPYSSLDPRFTIFSVLQEAMHLDRNHYNNFEKQHEYMTGLLAAVHLSSDILSRYPHEFSGGERQRIAIARALVMNPRLLILDEAVSSLDVLVQEQIIRLLMDLQKQYHLTYLFISHNLRVVRRISTRVAVMFKGKIVESAATEKIFKNSQHPYTKELLAAALDYRPIKRRAEIVFNENSQLTDIGGEHFVIQ